MTNARPLLVLVSGAPGSGKTTLARELARALCAFHLDRDDIWDGLRLTASRSGREGVAHGAHGVDVWFATIALMLQSGVSLVADGTLYRGRNEEQMRPLLELGQVVNVHCRATHALDRYRTRLLDEGTCGDEIAALVARATVFQDWVVAPLDLGCARIEVDTSEGYDPPLADLLAEIART